MTIASTKRCLFPEGSRALADQSNDECDGSAMDSSFGDEMIGQEHSPTTTLAYPMQAPRKEAPMKPTISMSDHGAEVMIDLSTLSLETPDKVRRFRRTNSLIDDDRRSSPTSSDDGSFVYCADNSPFAQCYQNACQSPFGLQTSIALCLGDSGDEVETPSSCNGCQAWSYFESDEEKHPSPLASPLKKHEAKNRAFSVKARTLRVKKIRRDLSPFAESPKTPKQLSKSRSFSIADHGRSNARVAPEKNRVSKEIVGVRGLTDVLQLCTLPENATTVSPMVIRPYPGFRDEEDVCYDSDPEDFARRRRRRNKECTKNQASSMYQRQVASTPTGKLEDVYNEETFCTVAQEFINSTFTLIFHSQKGGSSGSAFVVVNAWVERGQSFGESVFQPKWMWQPKSRGNESRQNMYGVQAIDLLNIKRVLKVDQMDRCRHPFAKPLNCFMVRSIDDEEFFFETESPTERDRLVYSMKMVIARFGAMVLEQDNTVYAEFFATCDPVPGKVPDVLTRLPD
jgi:hypothetical protein